MEDQKLNILVSDIQHSYGHCSPGLVAGPGQEAGGGGGEQVHDGDSWKMGVLEGGERDCSSY